jgi:glycerophosphoryl diester phosphodiesterase
MSGTKKTHQAEPVHLVDFFDRFGSQPLIIAHRGYRACYPENTLCAFAASIGRSRMIELDVQLSSDGVAVVFHDSHLTRTSNAAEIAGKLGIQSLALCDWRLDQLQRLDLGSWFVEIDPFNTLRHGAIDRAHLVSLMPQLILTLGELLTWAGACRMPLNIEIKDMRGTRMDRLIVPEVIREIRLAGAMDQVILSSFNHDYLKSCRHLAPEVALAALQEGMHPPDLVSYLQALDVCAYHPEDLLVDAPLVTSLQAAGMRVNVFTVNDAARQRQLFDFGVTGIFTDFPRRIEP